MFSTTTILLVVCLYMAILFGIAQLVENRAASSGSKSVHPLIYVLSITVYATSWTFYGSVGFAAESGFLYFAIYVGAILAILTWWRTLRRMVHAKETYHISSIADFISARYNRSQAVAALVTLIALVGTIPYIALQLKAVISTYEIIATPVTAQDYNSNFTGSLITLLMIIFTIMFGARRLDPTERHQGMMAVLAVQCVIKLVAFVAVGAFVTFVLYDGIGDIFQRITWAGLGHLLGSSSYEGPVSTQWITLIILGAASIQCLPRQFHVAVIENSNEHHIRMAMWFVPLYLVAISFFVIPIAAGGLMQGLPVSEADSFVLRLPQLANNQGLALVAFIGGFSAATGMIIISSMTLSTMATNHLLMIIIDRYKGCNFLRHYLLHCRWLMIALILSSSYWFAREFSDSHMLAAMGMISFAAVFQFVPSMYGGLFWNRGNKVGALLGLSAGFMTWFYTLVVPTFVNHGWINSDLMVSGPFQIAWLRPESLLGLDGLSGLSHSVFWSFSLNVLFYVLGSLSHRPAKLERTQLSDFMKSIKSGQSPHRARPTGLDAYILVSAKLSEAEHLLSEYMPMDRAEAAITRITEDLAIAHKEHITIIELVEFHRMLEHVLAGSIGAASAHKAIENRIKYTEQETKDLKAVYSHILSELHGQGETVEGTNRPSDDGDSRYSFIENLQKTIDEQASQLQQQQQALDKATEARDNADQRLFDQRIINQKLAQEVKTLRHQMEQENNDSSVI
ncbi:MAG: sodium:solute symporter [Motiliproteus sp.]